MNCIDDDEDIHIKDDCEDLESPVSPVPDEANGIGSGLVSSSQQELLTQNYKGIDQIKDSKRTSIQNLVQHTNNHSSQIAELDYGPDVFTLKEPSLFQHLQLTESSEFFTDQHSSPCFMHEIPDMYDNLAAPCSSSIKNNSGRGRSPANDRSIILNESVEPFMNDLDTTQRNNQIFAGDDYIVH